MKKMLCSLLLFISTASLCQGLTKAQLQEAADKYIFFLTNVGKKEYSSEWCHEKINELFAERCWKKSNNSLLYSTRDELLAQIARAKEQNIVWMHQLTMPIKINTPKKTVKITTRLQVESYGREFEPTQIIHFNEDGKIDSIDQMCRT